MFDHQMIVANAEHQHFGIKPPDFCAAVTQLVRKGNAPQTSDETDVERDAEHYYPIGIQRLAHPAAICLDQVGRTTGEKSEIA